jgi:hypothetical protein
MYYLRLLAKVNCLYEVIILLQANKTKCHITLLAYMHDTLYSFLES